MRTCKEVTRLISESLDRDLPLRERIGLRMHLIMCKFCSRYEKQTLMIRDAIGFYAKQMDRGESTPLHKLSKEARERIKSSLAEK
jgi:hypothetical protein